MSSIIKPTLAIMAAGEGRRYGSAKQIDPINEHLLLEYSIYDALEEGFGKVVILIREDIKIEFMERYGKKIQEEVSSRGADFDCVCQESLAEVQKELAFREKVWGTGYAALCFKDIVKEPAAIINADDFYGRESFRVLYKFFNEDYDANGNVHALVGYRLGNVVHSEEPVSEAVCKVSFDGFLEEIVERTEIRRKGDGFVYRENKRECPLNPDDIVSTTFWGFNPTIFPYLQTGFDNFLRAVKGGNDATSEFYLPDFVDELRGEGKIKVKVLPTEGKCFGMTYQEDRERIQDEIERLTRDGQYPDKLWEKD